MFALSLGGREAEWLTAVCAAALAPGTARQAGPGPMAERNLMLAGRWMKPKSAPDGDQIKLGLGVGGLTGLPGSDAGDV